MAESFIDVPFTSDAATLRDQAKQRLADEWTGWQGNDGDLEVVVIEAVAPMAQNAVETAAKVPPAAFRTILSRLHGVDPLVGSPATTTVSMLFTDSDPHTVPAGFEIQIDGVAFATDTDATGTSSVTGVPVTATVVGQVGNDLVGTTVAPAGGLAFLSDITVDAPTADGVDPESDEDYESRGSRELELQAKTLVTNRDYELMAIDTPGVGRAVAVSDTATRTMTVYAADTAGADLTAGKKTELLDAYEPLRLSNWTVAIGDPTHTTITVTADVTAEPGFDDADLQARISERLDEILDPAAFARPRGSGDLGAPRDWDLDTKVRRNKLIAEIGNLDGVDRVDDLTITGSAGSSDGSGNWTLPGTAPLPTPGSHTVSVT
jgi:hypothetical protein